MKKQLNFLTLLEAPGGYGKSYFINKLTASFPNIPVIKFFSDTSFPTFLAELQKSGILEHQVPTSLQEPINPETLLKKITNEIILVFDDFHTIGANNPIYPFLSYLLKNPRDNFHIIIASRLKINLPSVYLVGGGKADYYDKSFLEFSLEKFKLLWQENDLEFSDSDLNFFDYIAGWPLAVMLYLKYKTGALSKDLFESLLNEAVKNTLEIFNPGIDSIDSDKSANFYFYKKNETAKIFHEPLNIININNPQYWIYTASESSLAPKQKQLFLERALNVASAQANNSLLLNILTRLAHSYSLSADFSLLDQALLNAEKFLEIGKTVDKIAWMYLKANRMRHLCRHSEALILLNKILLMPCPDSISQNFQTRARVVLGLTEYQTGNYKMTRKYYNEALLLAAAEYNETLELEIKIMLAFLDTLEGKNNAYLPENIIELVNSQPLKAQPLMWLNLAFYRILGENFNLKTGINILQKIKEVSQKLSYDFLKPLIADIEARILRFSQDYDSALNCHQEALSQLDEQSFEYLQAKINLGLTLIKEKKIQESAELLSQVLVRALSAGAQGIVREINILLAEISPDKNFHNPTATQNLIFPNAMPKQQILEIKMFGSFQLFAGGKKIIKWGRKKSRDLIILLIFYPRGIHRETLADLIFSGETLDNPLKNLDVSIHSLRKVLEPERKSKESSFILFQDACYSFNWNYPNYIDIIDFDHIFKEWKLLYQSGSLMAKKSAVKLLNIYKGELLPELDFAGLLVEERESYRRKTLSVNNWLLEYCFLNNEIEEVEFWAEKLISLDNLEENAYLCLMKLAGIKKDKILLKNTYQRLITNFRKELDDNPSEKIISTYKSISKKCT